MITIILKILIKTVRVAKNAQGQSPEDNNFDRSPRRSAIFRGSVLVLNSIGGV